LDPFNLREKTGVSGNASRERREQLKEGRFLESEPWEEEKIR